VGVYMKWYHSLGIVCKKQAKEGDLSDIIKWYKEQEIKLYVKENLESCRQGDVERDQWSMQPWEKR
jgi:hypothetical protein